MRASDVMFESLHLHGVSHIFGNPGSTENSIMEGVADDPSLQYILSLHEGIAMGAATYYTQASGKPAMVNLHAAAGLGNALGMLYCGYKAGAPVLVTAGQQDTRMRLREPLLQHDLVAMARPVTKWSVQIERPDEVGPLLQRAFKVALDPPSGPVFVSLPVDVLEGETAVPATTAGPLHQLPAADPAGVEAAATLLLGAKNPVIVAGDSVAKDAAGPALLELATALGGSVWFEPLRARIPIPTDNPVVRGAMPFDSGSVRQAFGDADVILLVGGRFFEELWYDPAFPFPEGARIIHIEAAPERLAVDYAVTIGLIGGIRATLQALNTTLTGKRDASMIAAGTQRLERLRALKEDAAVALADSLAELPSAPPMHPAQAIATIKATLPADAIVVEESSTTRPDVIRGLTFDGPDRYFSGRGGGIGQGIPGAIGVKLACPDRPVVLISGDGSAMYSIQALWTAAHHRIPIVVLVFANREYRILKQNMDVFRSRFRAPSDRPYPHMDLTDPILDFVQMAAGMGVPAQAVDTPAALETALKGVLGADGPRLIEMIVS